MKQLTIDKIIGYVPYDLQCEEYYEHSFFTMDCENIIYVLQKQCKPLLNPIEEVFNIPEIMDEFTFYLFNKFTQNIWEYDDLLDIFTAKQLLLCYKHHIDVYGLLNDGLALNKKEVKNV